VEPKVFAGARGFFNESFNGKVMQAVGIAGDFTQDNHSRSAQHVLHDLHDKIKQPQDKLGGVILGEVFDAAVDNRKRLPTFGKWNGVNQPAENERMIWILLGFAYGHFILFCPNMPKSRARSLIIGRLNRPKLFLDKLVITLAV
jgi:dTDP-4-dehydrorhamnose 3,5-epimerase